MEWTAVIIYPFIIIVLVMDVDADAEKEITISKEILKYYKLKQSYEKKRDKQKEKLLKNEEGLSWKERRDQYRKLKVKVKCINCNKSGGTIFSSNQGLLTAVCGNKESPCDLNIEISKDTFDNIRNISYTNNNKIYKLKLKIISAKLDYLFGYISQEKTVELFDPLRAELAKLTAYQLEVDKQYTLAVNNPNKEALIREDVSKLELEINRLKKIGKAYLESESQALVKTMVENYMTIILPLNENIKANKYMVNGIRRDGIREDETDEIYNLVSVGYTTEQLERKILI